MLRLKDFILRSFHIRVWITLGSLLAISLSGCSPSLFLPKKSDPSLVTPTLYRKPNLACGQMDLSTSVLDQATFRSVFKCFNANHALEPISQLIEHLTDDQLSPLVDFLNKYVLNDKKRLYEIERTFQALLSEGIVDDSFHQIGKILKNNQLISSLIALLREGFFISDHPARVDPDFLKLNEWIASRLDYQQLAEGIEFGMNISSSPAFSGLQADLRMNPGTPTQYSFDRTMGDLFNYMQADHTHLDLGRVKKLSEPFFFAIQNGYGFSVGRRILGTEYDSEPGFLKTRLANISRLLSALTKGPDPTLISGLISALRELSGRPIRCLKGSKEIPDLGYYLIGELAEHVLDAEQFVLKEAPLALASFRSVCQYPPGLDRHYSLLRKFAEAGQIQILAELAKELYDSASEGVDVGSFRKSDRSLVRSLVMILGEAGSTQARCQGFECLIPFLSEIGARDAWKNILLLVSSPTAQDEKWLDQMLKLLVDPSFLPDLGITPFDLMMRAISRQDATHFLKFAMSLRDVVSNGSEYPEGFILHSLSSIRRAYLVNRVHPFLDLFREAMRDARTHEKIYQTFFEISEKSEFLESVELLSRMADDGRLKQLLESTVQLFHKFAISGRSEVNEADLAVQHAEPYQPSYFHQLTKKDLSDLPLAIRSERFKACEYLSFEVSLSDPSEAGFSRQLDSFLNCLNSEGQQQAAVQAIRFLNETKTSNNKSLFEVQMNWAQGLAEGPYALAPQQLKFLTDSWVSSFKGGQFRAFGNAISLLASSPDEEGHQLGALALSLKAAGHALTQFPQAFTYFEQSFARFLKSSHVPELFSDLTDLFRIESTTEPKEKALDTFESRLEKIERWVEKTPNDQSVFDRIKKWVRAKECGSMNVSSDEEVTLRAREIVNEVFDGVTNWDLVEAPSQSFFKKEVRKSWKLSEMRDFVHPVLAKMADPKGSMVSANINFTQYFSRNVDAPDEPFKHYDPDYLVKWFRDGLTDYKLITYFYPGAIHPRVRLVNSLDRFELVMMNVDFVMPVYPYKNMALQFFQEIAEGWGDLPDRKFWPPEIRAKYPTKGPRPYTMKEVVERIIHRANPAEDLDFLIRSVGLPALSNCHQNPRYEPLDPETYGTAGFISSDRVADYRIRLYNIKQVYSVLWENSSRSSDGVTPARMEFFRDLFFELFKSSRKSIREANYPSSFGEKSNLYFILHLSRLGVLRQIGRILQRFPENGIEWKLTRDIIASLVHLAQAPDAKALLESFVMGEKSRYTGQTRIDSMFLWKLAEETFDLLESQPEGQAVENLGRIAVFLLAGVESLDHWKPGYAGADSSSPDLMYEMVGLLNRLVREYAPLLAKNPGLIRLVADSATLPDFLEKAYFDSDQGRKNRLSRHLSLILKDHADLILNGANLGSLAFSDSGVKTSAEAARSSLFNVLHSSVFQNLQVGQQLEPLRLFMTEQAPYHAESHVQLARRLRFYLAHLTETGQFQDILRASYENSDNFNQLIKVLANGIGKNGEGELKNFLEIISRTLSEWAQ